MMSPDYFYLTACLVCALLGFSIGSSWTVAGTLGIGLMGIAAALDLIARDQCWRHYIRCLFWRQTCRLSQKQLTWRRPLLAIDLI